MGLLHIAAKLAFENHTSYVKKEKGKYCVKSEKNPNWSGGCYDTEEEAKKRLNQVEMFKHMSHIALMNPDMADYVKINPRKGPRNPHTPSIDQAILELEKDKEILEDQLSQLSDSYFPSWYENWSYRDPIKNSDNESTKSISEDIKRIDLMIHNLKQ